MVSTVLDTEERNEYTGKSSLFRPPEPEFFVAFTRIQD